jgi:alkaline phosphatase
MFEWDMHTTKPQAGLDHVVQMDKTIQAMAQKVSPDTLLLFTADHSFDLRIRSGKKGASILPDGTETKPKLRVEDGHTAEQVLVAAQGPGSEKVHGFLRNTDLFGIMMAAYGWKP